MKERESWLEIRSEESLSAAQPAMEREVDIPHRPVILHDGVLRADEVESDFVKAMSHELRTPLNVIIGLCQLLERDQKNVLSTEQRDAVDRMEKNAHSLLESVNRLLECVRTGQLQ